MAHRLRPAGRPDRLAAPPPTGRHARRWSRQIAIDAPADKVWAIIANFDALKDWHPAVAESPASKGNEEGSVRELKLKGGGALTETLESHDAAKMKYSYRAKDGGALPVTNYTSTISVKAEGKGRWSSGAVRSTAATRTTTRRPTRTTRPRWLLSPASTSRGWRT